MSIGSLFSGIGGLERGLEWAGLGPTIWQVEVNRACRAVLRRHWPNVRRLTHVEAVPGAGLPIPDVLCGGFPCQDLSQANPGGEGLDGERSGLFWRFLDCIDALQPPAVVMENVARLAGRDLDVVVAELCGRGFEVEAARIRAGDVGAPHRRERVFILAYADSLQRKGGIGLDLRGSGPGPRGGAAMAHPNSGRPQEQWEQAHGDEPVRRNGAGMGQPEAAAWTVDGPDGARSPGAPQPGLGGSPDGVSAWLDDARWPAPRGALRHEWEPPIVAPRRSGDRARLKMLGNSVVSHCAWVAGMRIRQVLGL